MREGIMGGQYARLKEGFEAAKEVLEGKDRRFKKYRRYLGI